MAIDDGGPLKILIKINNMIMFLAPGMMLTWGSEEENPSSSKASQSHQERLDPVKPAEGSIILKPSPEKAQWDTSIYKPV